ncbi:MAG TPA: hypothetical protein VG074_15010 [Acidimicrobiales bacterium]|nr:hypothetical protein [Acidimicrobiales bacterium]
MSADKYHNGVPVDHLPKGGGVYRFRDPAIAAIAAVASSVDAQMSATMVGRPQPQTTVEQPGGPFIRYTQPGNLPQYQAPGYPFGNLIQQPLVARAGYYRDFRLYFIGGGGVNGTTTVAATTDAPYNIATLVQFKDPFGTLIFSLPSFELYLVNLFSGGAGCGIGPTAAVANFPSFSAVSVGTTGTGDFSMALSLPLEFAKGIGTAPGANASVQPTLQVNLNTSAQFFSTAPGTVPTITLDVESDFYWLPQGAQIIPPSLGTSRQWILQVGNPPIAASSNNRISFPRLGGFLDTLILELRDSTNARVAAFPSLTNRFQLIIDGVPIDDSPMWKLLDDAYIAFGGLTLPTGVYVYTRKTSLNQASLGLLDTSEATISSNPGTLIEVQGQPWGSGGTPPYTLNVIIGQIVPRGQLPQGLPEV